MEPHVRDEQVIFAFRRRVQLVQVGVVAVLLVGSLVALGALMMFDDFFLSLDRRAAGLVLGLPVAAAVASFVRLYWRCPTCRASLWGHREDLAQCPACGVQLR